MQSFQTENKKLQKIFDDIKSKNHKPVYYLTGPCDYYINKIVNYIENETLHEDAKSLNQKIVYGKDTDLQQVVMWSMQFPMISDYQVIIIKEAQHLKGINQDKMIDLFNNYIHNPLKSTILCFAHKEKKLLGNSKLAKRLKSSDNVYYYESNKLKDWEVEKWIQFYVENKGLSIGSDAVYMLSDYVGNNMIRITQELKKVFDAYKGKTITTNEISEYVGISKQYNTFEFQNHILLKDFYKVMKIVNYFSKNPKNFAVQPLIETTYRTLTQLLTVVKYHQRESPNSLASRVGLAPFIVRKYYIPATKKYSYAQVINAIENLSIIDKQLKGIQRSSMTPGELLKEFILKFMMY